MRVYSTALETPWPTLEAGMTPIRGLARQAPLLRHSPRRSQHALARQVGWRAGRRRHGETSPRTTVPLALVALAHGLAIAADALRGLAATVRPPRLSHKNFTRLSNASNLLGQSAKSSSAS